jgi:hypothetical protein
VKPYRAMTPEHARRLADMLVGLPLPFSMTIGDGDARTLSQNALLHKWFGQIAAHFGDRDAMTVKGECHHKFGLPIKLRNEQFAWVWKQTGAKLTYSQQCNYLASGTLNVSSGMSVKELTEYMDAMARDYREQGVDLIDPEARKYEAAA